MKILLVNYEYKGQCGGAGLATFNMAREFLKIGHEVTLFIGWDARFGTPDVPDGAGVCLVPLKKKSIQQSSLLGLLGFVLRGLPEIRRLTRCGDFDIVQFYFSVPTGILKYGLHKKTPYVVSLRGLDIPGLHKGRKDKIFSRLTATINRAVVKDAAAVLSLSNESTEVYHSFCPEVLINIIPNAVNRKEFSVKKEYSNSVTKFVTVSRLISLKRLDLLIACVVKLRNEGRKVCLDIFGDGPLRDELSAQIRKAEATGYICLKGYEKRETITRILSEYDIFALPSTGESFANVILEAMAAGLPVISANKGGAVDAVEEGVTGIFSKPDDEKDLLNKLRYCTDNPGEMARMGKNGRAAVERKYSTESVAKRHLALYSAILASRRGSSVSVSSDAG